VARKTPNVPGSARSGCAYDLDYRTVARAPCRVRIVLWRSPNTRNTKSKESDPCRQAMQTAARVDSQASPRAEDFSGISWQSRQR
jgi:hypothetical protein